MLTKEQIQDAATALTCADPTCLWCVNARTALAAYERVAALLDDWKLRDNIRPSEISDLRRALEG